MDFEGLQVVEPSRAELAVRVVERDLAGVAGLAFLQMHLQLLIIVKPLLCGHAFSVLEADVAGLAERYQNCMLFPLDQDFLELRAIEGYVLRGRLDEFCIAGKVLLTSAGGMIMPIIGDSIINRQQDLRL